MSRDGRGGSLVLSFAHRDSKSDAHALSAGRTASLERLVAQAE